ncbi:retrotransposon protein [Cucumis melo var. makuwa]|uniref:Retrotransposon protein n=1 Tax=Cucumis melo var. makuwa TaxID=1194695 RepID=A0A5A7SS28_CUCMM|nr:retrotransposon protein [Cucumis melo var. makuwa]
MTNGEDLDDIDEGDLAYAPTTARDDIQYIETTNESNEPVGYEGFDMLDGNDIKFSFMYNQGIDLSQDDIRAS